MSMADSSRKTMQFNGVDPKDFATILEGFDEESPRSDGTVLPPMSKALFPERYEQGWRLSKNGRTNG
ncbi:hypothetical protein ACFS07_20100 [Undibacterium arcticum]